LSWLAEKNFSMLEPESTGDNVKGWLWKKIGDLMRPTGDPFCVDPSEAPSSALMSRCNATGLGFGVGFEISSDGVSCNDRLTRLRGDMDIMPRSAAWGIASGLSSCENMREWSKAERGGRRWEGERLD
jgi:chorismate synthase